MRSAPQLDAIFSLYSQAASATAAGSKSFYFATRFFPPELARAAHAVYWFCRTTDDLVDESPSPAQATADLEQWSAALRSALRGEPSDQPVLQLFARTAEAYGIPHEYPFDLIEGMRMDLTQNRYPDYAALRLFCYRVASVVGLMMMHVIGFDGHPEREAIDLGVAMQLTNILRDVGEDWTRGRIYLPQDELAAHGYSEADVAAGTRNDAFLELMRFQAARARSLYAVSEPGIASLHRDGRFAVKVAARVYAGILDRLDENGYDVYRSRAVVPARTKYWITMRLMYAPILRHGFRRLATVWSR